VRHTDTAPVTYCVERGHLLLCSTGEGVGKKKKEKKKKKVKVT
jgi:hypothetical protein